MAGPDVSRQVRVREKDMTMEAEVGGMWKHKSRNVGSLQKLEIKETVLLSFDKELELTLKYFNDIL